MLAAIENAEGWSLGQLAVLVLIVAAIVVFLVTRRR